MKNLLLSTGLAVGLGAFAFAPASAAPIATHGVILAPAASADVACRTVKRVVTTRGVRRVTTTRSCDRGPRYVERRGYYRGDRGYYGRSSYRDRGYYRPAPRPGLSINIR